ncbi:MAG TPA: IS1 family transposase [Bacteroidia bacterium]|jgi:insertion element IS1 protein InsB|nr:IS1 family transposase [Bacteroidia bacterium]
MNCKYCNKSCLKKGFQGGKQKYQCKTCKRYQQKIYTYKMCTEQDEKTIVKLNNIGVSISGIASFTGISKANVVNKIKSIAEKSTMPKIEEEQKEYEADELYTFIKNKNNSCYIMYAINKMTKQVIDFFVGTRTKENVEKVISKVKLLNPKRIFTDKLNLYPGLIGTKIHTASAYKINHIERFNLTLRTHLKRLSRKTICFSRSREMLESCLKLYLYKGNLAMRK